MPEKRYYWLKLKDNFFDSLRIKKLRRIAGGNTYVIIYLKLLLIAMQSEGVLEYEGLDEDIESELAEKIDEDVNNVRATITYFTKCSQIQPSAKVKEGLFFPEAIELVASESKYAQKMRTYRDKQQDVQNLQGYNVATNRLQCSPQQATLSDREREREEKDKEIDIEREGEREERVCNSSQNTSPTLPPTDSLSYGLFKNVILSQNEYNALTNAYPEIAQGKIENLSKHLHNNPEKTVKHPYSMLLKWCSDAVKQNPPTTQKKQSSFVTDIENHQYSEEDYKNMFDNFEQKGETNARC